MDEEAIFRKELAIRSNTLCKTLEDLFIKNKCPILEVYTALYMLWTETCMHMGMTEQQFKDQFKYLLEMYSEMLKENGGKLFKTE